MGDQKTVQPPLPPPPPPPPRLAYQEPGPVASTVTPTASFLCPEDEVKQCCTHLLEKLKNNELLLSFYTPTSSLIQQEKVCGLVAAEMALGSVEFAKDVSTEEMLQEAKNRGYTRVGEMFSVENLASLIRDMAGCEVEVLKTGLSESSRILAHLSAGNPLLVPYDVDVDNRPAVLNGRKAHWTVINGIVLRMDRNTNILPTSCENNPEFDNLIHCRPTNEDLIWNNVDNIYLLGKQGKSRYLGLWEYKLLMDSNHNLVELPKFIEENLNDYVVPEGGIVSGLKSKVILISKSL